MTGLIADLELSRRDAVLSQASSLLLSTDCDMLRCSRLTDSFFDSTFLPDLERRVSEINSAQLLHAAASSFGPTSDSYQRKICFNSRPLLQDGFAANLLTLSIQEGQPFFSLLVL